MEHLTNFELMLVGASMPVKDARTVPLPPLPVVPALVPFTIDTLAVLLTVQMGVRSISS